MGLKESGTSDAVADTFSDDVLKIEICSPEQEHLSVIDVPGIFRNTLEGMTTDSDIDIVRNMVNGYMKNPRSVILAVVPANVDIATQEILKMAEKCDTKGERTLGVLTKPDLVDRGAENRVVDLVEGKLSVPDRHSSSMILMFNRQKPQAQARLVDGQKSWAVGLGRSHFRQTYLRKEFFQEQRTMGQTPEGPRRHWVSPRTAPRFIDGYGEEGVPQCTV